MEEAEGLKECSGAKGRIHRFVGLPRMLVPWRALAQTDTGPLAQWPRLNHFLTAKLHYDPRRIVIGFCGIQEHSPRCQKEIFEEAEEDIKLGDEEYGAVYCVTGVVVLQTFSSECCGCLRHVGCRRAVFTT